MLNLHWELSVLARSVAFGNLSGAAVHVGLSQPQLSRIVSKIESELHITLLDRSARRKSGWTAMVFKLAEVYSRSSRNLEGEIQQLIQQGEPTLLKAATLEGLGVLAAGYCHKLVDSSSIQVIELDVHDLNRLEELFLAGELDLIFTSREPGRKKFKYSHELGFQSLDRAGKDSGMQVMSTFEYGTAQREKADKSKILVSNSLEVRRGWIQKFGGRGFIPSEVRKKAGKDDRAVKMIASDQLSEKVWGALVS